MVEEGIVHYYGSEDEPEGDEVEDDMLEQSQSPTAEIRGQNHISRF